MILPGLSEVLFYYNKTEKVIGIQSCNLMEVYWQLFFFNSSLEF